MTGDHAAAIGTGRSICGSGVRHTRAWRHSNTAASTQTPSVASPVSPAISDLRTAGRHHRGPPMLKAVFTVLCAIPTGQTDFDRSRTQARRPHQL